MALIMSSNSKFQRIKLLQNFLIPHLNWGTFGDKLYWINRESKIFFFHWRHQSSSQFRPDDSKVYKEWAVVKGLWNADDTKAICKAKQRVRAALLKLRCIKCIKKTNDYRIYKILNEEERKKSEEHFEIQNSNFGHSTHFLLEHLQEEEILHEIFMEKLLSEESENKNYFGQLT
ncbi:interferon regulatory factor 8 isoform X1 [Parasteatoda tepidariorum]|uniref:interferon regulatory factor 8 isoform X1 n=2 Tax=Parasteatoda tepidariorum TaxID=114398 RepID=UPI001C720924|nr:uncharacterized protein LOC107446827 isoform X1 [Parasteatoda tepidariorum]